MTKPENGAQKDAAHPTNFQLKPSPGAKRNSRRELGEGGTPKAWRMRDTELPQTWNANMQKNIQSTRLLILICIDHGNLCQSLKMVRKKMLHTLQIFKF